MCKCGLLFTYIGLIGDKEYSKVRFSSCCPLGRSSFRKIEKLKLEHYRKVSIDGIY